MYNIYEEYAILESEIAERELKKEQLRTAILQNMVERGEKQIKTAIGTFSWTKPKIWTYPEWVNDLEAEMKIAKKEIDSQIKEAKAKAESTKEATYVEENALRFLSTKL